MSRHHRRVKWSGRKVTDLRAHWAVQIDAGVACGVPVECGRCGGPIWNDQPFDLGHRVDLAEFGDVNAAWPEHALKRDCPMGGNRSAGGHLGNRIKRERRQRVRKWL